MTISESGKYCSDCAMGSHCGCTCRHCHSEKTDALARAEAAEREAERLRDLVRYQRGPLLDVGLITEDEYAKLLLVDGAVNRLSGYDGLRADLASARERIGALERIREKDFATWKAVDADYQQRIAALEAFGRQVMQGLDELDEHYAAGTALGLGPEEGA